MKSLKQNQNRVNWVPLSLTLTASVLLTGCGQGKVAVTRDDAVTHREPQHQVTPMAAGEPGPTANLGFFAPQILSQLMGIYTGTIQGWALNGDAFSQPFSLTLTSTQQNGMTMAYATFQTGGGSDTTPISFTSWVAPGLTGMYVNNVATYSFVTQILDIPSISEFPVAIEIILALGGTGYTFVPRQSAIFVKDCRFSQGVECNNDFQDVWFLDDLGKRN
ncbi:MAG: hypothetical protein A2070_14015 [Bdellovibrionales bacterium GWC1_52_8]|nr:MAG: hypothetical protein A2Z97_16530 [Bdellovibrionales bacterium GWB1_52_6]OFZ02865.1 MAG: hypothetical protein A2X97_04640 [Bdellovibrionales bacterium GWA1_52_35]OFZ38037.1 MAG: hypothetical protein A2070_14015 [Bdellovibrionales bacterium GWC1_52_8]HCM38446.1 hypothetical protein [Bdellovibrionales bacterium]